LKSVPLAPKAIARNAAVGFGIIAHWIGLGWLKNVAVLVHGSNTALASNSLTLWVRLANLEQIDCSSKFGSNSFWNYALWIGLGWLEMLLCLYMEVMQPWLAIHSLCNRSYILILYEHDVILFGATLKNEHQSSNFHESLEMVIFR
jgi:hypothetical protein